MVYGLASFVPMRVLEQIKLDVCYENLPIVLIGDGAGLVYSHLGASHQCTEDVAALRALPEMAILSPCDAHEMTSCMELALTANHPVYLRMGKADLGAVHLVRPVLDWGKLCLLKAGSGDLAWVATGSMVKTALALAEQWQGSAVWSAPCIKPLRPEQVRTLCGKHRALIVLEEHSVLGGLGSAMTEIVTTESPAWVLRVGVQDRFSQKCGSYGYLLQEHGLTPELIAQQVRRFVARMTSPGRRAA